MGKLTPKKCAPAKQLAIFREMSKEFALVRMNGKRPVEKGWQKYCYDRREFDEIGFRMGDNAGIACGPASGVLVLDIDDSEAFEEVASKKRWTLPLTYTVLTGSGNFHHYFQYPQDGKQYGNKNFKKLGFDLRGVGGVIVAPCSIHPDTGMPYIIHSDVLIADPPDWLLDLYDDGRLVVDCTSDEDISPDEDVDVSLIPISEDTKRLIIGGAPKGKRSEAIMSAINSLVNAGVETAKIFGIFESYPIGEKYREKGNSKRKCLNAHIEKAKESKFKTAQQTVETFTAIQLDEEDVLPPDWIIEGLLPVGLTLLAGAPKAGKTRLVTQIGLGVSTGEKIFEKIEVNKCDVLCLFLEDSKWRIKERLRQEPQYGKGTSDQNGKKRRVKASWTWTVRNTIKQRKQIDQVKHRKQGKQTGLF
jgi:hypothetical protein